MAHVMVLDSLNEDIFVCGNCKSVFNSLPCYLEHKRITCNSVLEDQLPIGDNLQPAPELNIECGETSTLPQDNETEVPQNNNSVTDLTCNLCFKRFKKAKGLLAHIRLHKDKSYQCPICGRCFIQNSHLQRHTVSHKEWPGGVIEKTPKSPEADLLSYVCPYCDQLSPTYNKFRQHMKCHYDLKQYKCIQEGCLRFFDNINTLLGHVSEMHPDPVYTCHLCNDNFNTLENIAVHQQHHTEYKTESKTQPKNYKCPKCEAIFTQPNKFSFHIFAENHKRTCIHCKKTFASEKRLRLHLQIHRDIKPFECKVCGSSFHMKKYLTTHMLKHGQRSFQCLTCNSMFKRRDLLQRHMRLHLSKKMYPCPFKDTSECMKEFSRRDKLKEHLKCHAKDATQKNMQNKTCTDTLSEPSD